MRNIITAKGLEVAEVFTKEKRHLNAKSNTPILDLKPYIPDYDSAIATVPDWLNHR